MSDARSTKLKQAVEDVPIVEIRPATLPSSQDAGDLSPAQRYLKRQAQVMQQDHAELCEYLQKKIEREQQQKARWAEPPPAQAPASRLNRRSLLTWAAGTAVAG